MINETINELPKDTNDEVTIKRGRGDLEENQTKTNKRTETLIIFR